MPPCILKAAVTLSVGHSVNILTIILSLKKTFIKLMSLNNRINGVIKVFYVPEQVQCPGRSLIGSYQQSLCMGLIYFRDTQLEVKYISDISDCTALHYIYEEMQIILEIGSWLGELLFNQPPHSASITSNYQHQQ